MNRELSKKSNIKRPKRPTKRGLRKKVFLKRKRRKFIFRRFFLVAIFLSVVFLFFFGIHFSLSKFFTIKNISVQGSSSYSDAEVISAGELHTKQNLLFLNSKKAENKIYTSLPNVDEVKISKKFPNNLIISLEDAIPTYHLKIENEYIVISAKNKFLAKFSEPPDNTVGLIGIEAEIKENGKVEYRNPESLKLMEEILNTLRSKEIENINEVDISDLQNITLKYENRIKINIGSQDDLDYKILTLKEILNNKISKTERGTLNLKDLKTQNRTYFTYE